MMLKAKPYPFSFNKWKRNIFQESRKVNRHPVMPILSLQKIKYIKYRLHIIKYILNILYITYLHILNIFDILKYILSTQSKEVYSTQSQFGLALTAKVGPQLMKRAAAQAIPLGTYC